MQIMSQYTSFSRKQSYAKQGHPHWLHHYCTADQGSRTLTFGKASTHQVACIGQGCHASRDLCVKPFLFWQVCVVSLQRFWWTEAWDGCVLFSYCFFLNGFTTDLRILNWQRLCGADSALWPKLLSRTVSKLSVSLQFQTIRSVVRVNGDTLDVHGKCWRSRFKQLTDKTANGCTF